MFSIDSHLCSFLKALIISTKLVYSLTDSRISTNIFDSSSSLLLYITIEILGYSYFLQDFKEIFYRKSAFNDHLYANITKFYSYSQSVSHISLDILCMLQYVYITNKTIKLNNSYSSLFSSSVALHPSAKSSACFSANRLKMASPQSSPSSK